MALRGSVLYATLCIVVGLVALAILNGVGLPRARQGCLAATCNYVNASGRADQTCQHYRVYFGNDTSCLACLAYQPVNGSRCYDDGTSGCPKYLSCRNLALEEIIVVIDILLSIAIMVGLIVALMMYYDSQNYQQLA